LSDECITHGFEKFGGVKRRFTRVGEIEGTIVIDDYAHHPVEIRAVLSAARDSTAGRVIAVVQPHRFSRLRDLMEDFANAFVEADVVLVAPVYAAGEQPIEGVDAEALAEGIRAHGHRMVQTVSGPDDLANVLRDLAADGDLVICMGAGDITKWAAGLAEAIRAERANKS
jgi:UDP-N-acetylmuramate--alanine ligase